MKKLLLILLCLPLLFGSCQKEDDTNSINSQCPENRFIEVDINGSSYYDNSDGSYKTADGSYNFCQYHEPIDGEYIMDDAYLTSTFHSNGIIDLDIHNTSSSKAYFKISIEDIANKSLNVSYPIIKDSDIELVNDDVFINYYGWISNRGCRYSYYNGSITFTQIDLSQDNDIVVSGNFEFTAWSPYSQSNYNPAECTDTIHITNGIIHNISNF